MRPFRPRSLAGRLFATQVVVVAAVVAGRMCVSRITARHLDYPAGAGRAGRPEPHYRRCG
ncbi:hypothetical protein [Streptomyces sp. SS8]